MYSITFQGFKLQMDFSGLLFLLSGAFVICQGIFAVCVLLHGGNYWDERTSGERFIEGLLRDRGVE